MTRIPFAVMISGRGSNMIALLRAAEDEDFPGLPVLVLSNKPDAGGLLAARAHGVPSLCIDHRVFKKDREAFEREVDAALRAAGAEFVALAGFMRVLTPWFVHRWAGRLINIHPSLLPKYKGLDTHARAIEAGDAEAGCTVHYVNEGVDEGTIIDQARVPILPGDTPETLAARILPREHELYPQALKQALMQMPVR
ncbi:MAG: phosphoribosylglycinamide formyltransferase [Hyphomonadaceae bacterium]|nr:phosphoribosylglycinamide formyltransferase [Hyphomonadaceae bacterium]